MAGERTRRWGLTSEQWSKFGDLIRFGFWAGTAALLAALLVPQADLPQLPASDKIEHVVAFAIVSLLAGLAYRRAVALRLALVLIVGGAVVEIVQAMMPYGRTGDPKDAIADLLGVALGMSIAFLLTRLLRIVKLPALAK